MLIMSTLPHLSLVKHETQNENLTIGFNGNLASNL